jgi:heme-degrading monooxygenase HmoA
MSSLAADGKEHEMILRRWSARATEDGEQQYLRHFHQKVLPHLQQVRGYQGVLLLRREVNALVEIQVLTFWDTMDAIRQFAGTDIDSAVVEGEAKAVLDDFDTRVTHCEVVLDTRNIP